MKVLTNGTSDMSQSVSVDYHCCVVLWQMYIYSFLVDVMLASLQQLLESLLERSTKEAVPWQVWSSLVNSLCYCTELFPNTSYHRLLDAIDFIRREIFQSYVDVAVAFFRVVN